MIFTPTFSGGGVLPEYPRPQKQRDSYLSLNGFWQYAFSDRLDFLDQFEGEILVPYSPESSLSTVNRQLKSDEFLHLKKTFSLPSDFNKGRVWLNVGACDQVTKVYLNGEFLYQNNDGYTSFTVELTNILGGENTLYLVVSDNASSDCFGRGKQKYKSGGIWYTAISGIWQSVFLESTPKIYIKDFKYYIDFDNKKLTVKVDAEQNTQVSVEVFDQDNLICQGVAKNGVVTLDVSCCKPWEINSPELYVVKLSTSSGDKITSYFGLRKFSKVKVGDKWYFAINNKPVFLNGLLDQGYFYGGIYTPKTNESMYQEILTLKNMGFNMLRKHIKVEHALWYYYCDILGMVVFQDMLNGGKPYKLSRIVLAPFINLKLNDSNYKSMGRDNENSRKQYYYEANRLIDQLFNVTSICLWTPFNEGWGQFDALKTVEILSKKDSSRLFDHASGWQDMGGGDVNSKHIYFRKLKGFSDEKRIFAITEFGGYSYYVKDHVFSNKKFGYRSIKSQNALQTAIEKLYLTEVVPLIESSGLSSVCYTQVSDVEGEINGLFTYDRVLKVDIDKTKQLMDKVYLAFDKHITVSTK